MCGELRRRWSSRDGLPEHIRTTNDEGPKQKSGDDVHRASAFEEEFEGYVQASRSLLVPANNVRVSTVHRGENFDSD